MSNTYGVEENALEFIFFTLMCWVGYYLFRKPVFNHLMQRENEVIVYQITSHSDQW